MSYQITDGRQLSQVGEIPQNCRKRTRTQ